MHFQLGGPTVLAFKKKDSGLVYAVQQVHGVHKDHELLLTMRHSNIVTTFETFQLQNNCFLVQECMDVTLAEVIACPWSLKEAHIATVCQEVSNLCLEDSFANLL